MLLVAVAIAAIVVAAARRHSHRRGRRPHVDFRLGWGRPARPAETSLSKEIAFTFMLGTFAGLLVVLGVYLQVRFPTVGDEAVLYMAGGAIVEIAIWIGLGILSEGDPRYALGIPFIVDDTTDDK